MPGPRGSHLACRNLRSVGIAPGSGEKVCGTAFRLWFVWNSRSEVLGAFRGERLISNTTSLFTRYKFLRYCFIRGIGSRFWHAEPPIPVRPPGPRFDRAQRPLNGLRGRLNRALR